MTSVYGGINPASLMPVRKGHSLSIYLKEMGWRKKSSRRSKSDTEQIKPLEQVFDEIEGENKADGQPNKGRSITKDSEKEKINNRNVIAK